MVKAWAVVTGASSGIGEAFARRLAAEQLGLVLVARRGDRLRSLAAELEVPSTIVQADLAEERGRDELWAAVRRLEAPVDLLVNNAGFGLKGAAAELSRERQLEMIQINCTALTDLALRYLALRAEGGGIINVASIVGLRPLAFLTVYAATKSFVVSFSRALAEEVAPRRMRVLALCPGPVPTGFQQVAGTELDLPSRMVAISAEQTVDEALAALERGERVWVPGMGMRWAARLLAATPGGITTRLSARSYRGR